ncbi:MAG: DUF3717 domain-containing protein [Pigmentiphaga sp.]|uniref:DUF3717 domain-containing protein n=1 Tax=Pigmentiphaga sp. TaxID=1977564 RepID=UPI0029B2A9A3|nr:DUF3717 domain-containing protein [Pigmentiphaga sp.]MDX3906031.1 DUF3717 domain-containing protein [Pigmentiphaga sp.]
MEITLTELEDAINYWRARKPSQGEERTLCAEAAALAVPYAAMIMGRRRSTDVAQMPAPAQEALRAWLQARRPPAASVKD